MKTKAQENRNSTGILNGDMNPLKLCINSLVSAMKADYGHLFKSQFSSNEDIIMYQSRLYSKLEGAGYTKKDIVDGYEGFVDNGSKYPPTVPELMSSIKEKSRKIQYFVSLPKLPRVDGADIDCHSYDNKKFNEEMIAMGHPELCVADEYTELEVDEMKKTGQNFLKSINVKIVD